MRPNPHKAVVIRGYRSNKIYEHNCTKFFSHVKKDSYGLTVIAVSDQFIYLCIFARNLQYEQWPFVYSKLPTKLPFKINCVKANLDHKASITSSCGKNLTQERTNVHKKA